MLQKQIEAAEVLAEVHREQDRSHLETVRRHNGIMQLIEVSRKGIRHEKTQDA